MTNTIVPQVLILTSALRQGFEMDGNPGNAVQGSSQNPGQVHLNGFFSIEKIAARAWEALQQYYEATKPKSGQPPVDDAHVEAGSSLFSDPSKLAGPATSIPAPQTASENADLT